MYKAFCSPPTVFNKQVFLFNELRVLPGLRRLILYAKRLKKALQGFK
jgi:hypothetical protein